MPTNRRRRTQERRTSIRDLDPDLERELLTGTSYFSGESHVDDETLRRAWEMHRDRLLDEWRDQEGPGSRPFAWWLFEAVPKYGERRILPGSECLIEHRDGWIRRNILHTHLDPPGQEEEAVYLRRHDLLDDDELSSLTQDQEI